MLADCPPSEIGLLGALTQYGSESAANMVLLAAGVLWVMGFLYNWRYKESGLVGNLFVSTSVASTFVVGGIASAGLANGLVWTFGAVAFIFDLAEEIAGGAMDLSGDTLRNVKSLARILGKHKTLGVSVLLFALVIAGTFVPVAMGLLGNAYFVMAAIADSLVVYFAVSIHMSKTPEEVRSMIRSLYLSAVGLVFAFLLGSVLRLGQPSNQVGAPSARASISVIDSVVPRPHCFPCQIEVDVLHTSVLIKRVQGEVLPKSGLLEAAMRHFAYEQTMLVDPDSPEIQLVRHPHTGDYVPPVY